MSNFNIKETVSGYLFTWETEQIQISVTRLHTHSSDGRVTGEVFIKNEHNALYPASSFNFSAPRTRSELINTLKKSYEELADWENIIYQLCHKVQALARAGEPVKELLTTEELSRPEYLVEPILFKGLPTIIYGEKAAFKSGMGLVIYTCLMLPWYDNPLGFTTLTRRTKTLYLDWEVNAEVAQWNLKRIVEGMGLGAMQLYYRRSALPLVDDIEQIQSKMVEIGAEALIVDSLGPAVGGDLNKPEQALAFTTALRKLKCTALIIAQTSKERESKHKSVYGSTFFEYYARNIFELRPDQQEDENEINIALFNTYCNLAKKHKPMGFKVRFEDNDTKIVIQQEEITSPEFLEKMGLRSQIYEELKHNRLTIDELSEFLGQSKQDVVKELKRIKNVRRDGNKWFIPTIGMGQIDKLL